MQLAQAGQYFGADGIEEYGTIILIEMEEFNSFLVIVVHFND
jgi:hypothetical protein